MEIKQYTLEQQLDSRKNEKRNLETKITKTQHIKTYRVWEKQY